MIVGIDIGSSTTDAVLVDDDLVVASVETNEPFAAACGSLAKLVAETGRKLNDVEVVAVTGGGAHAVGERLLDLPVRHVPEIDAIGVGGTALAGKTDALVVSMGTGTALVCVRADSITHVGGTAVGGGTLRGLARHLLDVTCLDTLAQMAERGDVSRVDLSIAEVAGGPIGYLPAEATASNFGKLSSDPTANDKAAGLVNMVSQVILTTTIVVASATGLQDIVLTGKLLRVEPLMRRMRDAYPLLPNNFLVPPRAEVATAVGAAHRVRGGRLPA
jgi:type II pantothenate kinase